MPFPNLFLNIFVLLGKKNNFQSFQTIWTEIFHRREIVHPGEHFEKELRTPILLKVAEIITYATFFWRIHYIQAFDSNISSAARSPVTSLALIQMVWATAASKYKIYYKLGSEWNESNSRQRGLWVCGYILTYIGLLGFAFIRKVRLAFAWMWYTVQSIEVL